MQRQYHPFNRISTRGNFMSETILISRPTSSQSTEHGIPRNVELALGGKLFCFTATPCKHAPGQECVGFVIETVDFGKADDGWPNAIYFTGDIVYMDELAAMGQRSYIAAAIMNTGEAHAVRMFRDTKTDCIVPMNYNAWDHFTQHREGLAEVFESEGVLEKVKWLSLGKSVKILTANP
ncbi:zn-dependent hydrolases of the beta-lactamase [Colletotrichum incanum]|uniref:Zn-dependent hydrolases of the beta-lactamase n=1 Tax=Colletotrichum incanum TaxID=1573173 RepID=A0A166M2H2_COLIC|nr:zn-dependent hydrolases of the beta-lactamase [Colletotrichum incanum]